MWCRMGTLEADEVTLDNERMGRRWGFMNTILIGDGKTTYLNRLAVLTTPWFSIKLHRIYRPDQQRDLHDHPWNFLSIILRGSYKENTPQGIKHRKWFNWKRAEDSHTIRWVSRVPVWTLVFTGAARRVWGFHTVHGWVAWDQYEKLNDA